MMHIMLASVLIFFLVLSILVVVHEFGHYWVAKRNGILVEEFGFGIPPRIYGKKIGETVYSINLLPFGGFVRLHGEASEEGLTDPTRAFVNKSKKVRIAVIIAGVVMNLALAVVCFSIVYSFLGITRESGKVKIVDIQPDTPAASSQLVIGDVIKSVNGKKVMKTEDVINEVVDRGGKHNLILDSNGVEKKAILDTRQSPTDSKWYMGVVLTSTEVYFPPVWQRPFYGVYYGVVNSYRTTKTVVMSLFGAVSEASRGKAPEGTVGPVGLLGLVDYVRKLGILPLVDFIGLISINLAVINILPFPALDGGRLLFIFIEKLIGRKVLPKVEAAIHSVGMIILLILLFSITIKDVRGVISAGGISGFINSLVK